MASSEVARVHCGAGGSDAESEDEGGAEGMEATGGPAAPGATAAGSARLSDTTPAPAWMDDDGAATEADGLMVRHCTAAALAVSHVACLFDKRACASPGQDSGRHQLRRAAADSAAACRAYDKGVSSGAAVPPRI